MFLLLLSSAYTEPRPLLLLTPPVSRLGVHKKLGGDTAGTADPQLTKGISHTIMTSCSAYKAEGRRRKGEDIQSDGICLPK